MTFRFGGAAPLALAAVMAMVARSAPAALILDGIPPPPDPGRMDDYLNARQAQNLGWSPQGQLLVATRFGETEQLHLVERAGGDRRQLTFLREPVDQAAFSPDPLRQAYVFVVDRGGGGHGQIFYQRLGEGHAGEPAKLLTDGRSRNGGALWSNFGREIAFFTNARDAASYDIDVIDPESGTLPRLVLAGDGADWSPIDWSPDDRKLLVLKRVSDAESYLYVVELASGTKREVEPAPGRVRIMEARFSRDGQGVYLVSDRDGEFAQLHYVNLFTGEKTVLSGHIPWDVDGLALSRDGRYLAYVADEAGASRLNIVDLRARQELIAPQLPGTGVIGSLHFDLAGRHLAFDFGAPNRPRDAFVLDVETNRLEAWTRSEPGAVDLAKFVTPRQAEFPAFDRPAGRTRLPVAVYQSRDVRPHPVLIVLGGGPSRQFRPVFDPWIQYLVNELGYAVLEPTLRGSAGYGKTFRALDGGNLREDAVKDIGALLVWLGSQGDFDAKSVVVAGSGHGGYLALAALINYGDRLRGGIDFGGTTDFVGDERDPDARAFLRRISPLTGAERISKPLLVVHGRNDPLVPMDQSQQLVNRLRARGMAAWYLTADDEGAEFRQKSDRDGYLRIFAQFLSTVR